MCYFVKVAQSLSEHCLSYLRIAVDSTEYCAKESVERESVTILLIKGCSWLFGLWLIEGFAMVHPSVFTFYLIFMDEKNLCSRSTDSG